MQTQPENESTEFLGISTNLMFDCVNGSAPLQGASSLASDDRYAGEQQAARVPCYTSLPARVFGGAAEA
ncbi:hypothetical protein ACFS07_02110 [Undibacterium arcticum]